MPGPFGQAAPTVDLGLDIGAGYQQDAMAKIAQAKVKQRKDYTSGYASKYGVKDTAAATKGLSDTQVYELATNLVNKRRGASKPSATAPKVSPPKITPKPVVKKPVVKKPVPKPPRRRSTAKRPVKKPTATTTIKPPVIVQQHGATEY